MPPRTKKADDLPSTMKELKDTLWKAADKLRGSMDASQYKDVILGLVFLKYVSDAFGERRLQIHDELAADINAAPPGAKVWRGWPIRRVPATEQDVLTTVLTTLARQRASARERLALLDELEHLVVRGVASGSLHLTDPDTHRWEGH